MKQVTRTILAIVVLLSAGITTIAQDSVRRLTLKDAVDLAIKNNLDVRQSELDVERAKAGYQQAWGSMLPSLNGNANHGRSEGRNVNPFDNTFITESLNSADYSISSQLILFNGLRLQNALRQNSLGRKASELEYQQMKDNVTLNVILAYLQVLNNTDLVAQSINQAEVSRQQVERLEVLNSEGAIPPGQLYDLKGQLADNQLTIINNQNNLQASKLTLSQLMNIPFTNQLEVERISLDQFSTDYPAMPDAIYESAVKQLAIMRAATLRTQSAKYGVRSAKGELYPVVSLNGIVFTQYSSQAFQDVLVNSRFDTGSSYVQVNGTNTKVWTLNETFRRDKISFSDQLDNNLYKALTISLRLPLFNGFQARSRVRLAKIEEKNSQYIEENTRIRLNQNIEQAHFNMTAARSRYTALTEQVAAFGESFRTAEERFNAGAINSVDYVIAKNNLDRANINLIVARYDFLLRTKILDFYQGKLTW
jgi:outer membrane protein